MVPSGDNTTDDSDQVQCLAGFGCQGGGATAANEAPTQEEPMQVDGIKQEVDQEQQVKDGDEEELEEGNLEEGDEWQAGGGEEEGNEGEEPEAAALKKRGRKRSSTGGDTAVTKRRPILPGSKKRGIPKGSKITSNKKLDDWYFACKKYEEINKIRKLSQAEFLRSEESGDLFTGKVSEQQSFGRYLNKYKSGELKPTAKKRHYPRKYEEIEERLIKYYDLRSSLVGAISQKFVSLGLDSTCNSHCSLSFSCCSTNATNVAFPGLSFKPNVSNGPKKLVTLTFVSHLDG